mmetsp:Transcript_8787/g.24134  ORF Transcript_8787/g.24134 Transcript_8787/m.24134 type:complete len:214 (+) Transcript_8787:726-1367(+)
MGSGDGEASRLGCFFGDAGNGGLTGAGEGVRTSAAWLGDGPLATGVPLAWTRSSPAFASAASPGDSACASSILMLATGVAASVIVGAAGGGAGSSTSSSSSSMATPDVSSRSMAAFTSHAHSESTFFATASEKPISRSCATRLSIPTPGPGAPRALGVGPLLRCVAGPPPPQADGEGFAGAGKEGSPFAWVSIGFSPFSTAATSVCKRRCSRS